jgi:LppX/LprAFG-like lipoprotein
MFSARARRLGTLTIVAALALSACNSAPALSDPTEILTKAIDAFQDAKTVHLAATLDGTFTMDLTGQGGGAMELTGTTLAGDVDIEHTKAKFTFAVPALLGLSGEVIAIDKASYVKTSLTGEKYQKSDTTDGLPVDPTNPDATIADIKAFLEKPEISPTKGDDVDCNGEKCYSVTIELSAAELASLSSPDPSSSIDPGTGVNLTILVERDSLKLHKVTASVAMGATGNLTVVLTFTDWDKAVTIEAPPDDQVTEGGGLPF